MKREILVLLLLVSLLSLAACQREELTVATSDSATVPMVSEMESLRSTEPEATELETKGSEYEVWREPNSIVLYPFTEAELAEAQRVAEAKVESFAQGTGVLTYEVERVAYDPDLTDADVRAKIAVAPVEGWSEKDYYERNISFVVTHTATYDHKKSPMPDCEHDVFRVDMRRDNAQSPWYVENYGVPVDRYSDCALSREEVAELETHGEFSGALFAAYRVEDSYMLYVYNESEDQFYYIEAWIENDRLQWEEILPLSHLNANGT